MRPAFYSSRWAVSALLLLTLIFAACDARAASSSTIPIAGTIKDALARPLSGVAVELQNQAGVKVATTRTNQHGYFHFDAAPGRYTLITRKRGFAPAVISVDTTRGKSPPLTIAMASEGALMMPLTARRQMPRNAPSSSGTTTYRFDRAAIEQLPEGDNTPLRQLLVQAPGVSQDSYGQGQGQIHIHGENGGGIQYRINGVFVPDAISGFSDFLSPRLMQSLSLITGAMPARFGYRNEGVIEMRTKDGCATPGGSAEFYGGQRETIQPSFDYGGCLGKLSYFASGSYLRSNLGLEAPTSGPSPTHDHTEQGQFLSSLSYQINATTKIAWLGALAVNSFQIPPNPDATPQFKLAGVSAFPARDVAETEFEQNYFGIVSLEGSLGSGLEYQLSFFSRYYRLNFDPDPVGDLIYNGVASRLTHAGFVNGIQGDASYAVKSTHLVRAGFYLSGETLEMDDHARSFPANSDGTQASDLPIAIVDDNNARAMLYGIYAEDEWRLTKTITLSYGARWDLMDAFAREWQFSPRAAVVYRPTRKTEVHAGYARYFQVPAFESVSLESLAKFEGTTAASAINGGNQRVQAEEDNYFDIGGSQELPHALNLSLEGFFFLAHNKLDLAQFGNTFVFAPLNYRRARSWGADLSLTKAGEALSGYFNFSYAVLQAIDISAGQFLTDDPQELAYIANHWIPLDDDQMFTASAGASYRWRGFLFSIDSIWGSGYRRGFANSGTLPPILQVDAAIARSFRAAQLGLITCRVAVLNVFDHPYQIRNGTGIGVASAQWGPRRAVYGGVKVPLPAMH